MLLYSTLLSKKIARAPGGYKKFMLTKLGGGGGGGGGGKQNRYKRVIMLFIIMVTMTSKQFNVSWDIMLARYVF